MAAAARPRVAAGGLSNYQHKPPPPRGQIVLRPDTALGFVAQLFLRGVKEP